MLSGALSLDGTYLQHQLHVLQGSMQRRSCRDLRGTQTTLLTLWRVRAARWLLARHLSADPLWCEALRS